MFTLHAFDPVTPTPPTRVWFHDGRILAVVAPEALPRAPAAVVTGSRWMHPALRWDFESRKLPSFHTTCVAQKYRAWKSKFGQYLSAEVKSVLRNGFLIPMRHHQPPCHHPNHQSVEQMPAVMDKLFAKYMITGCVRPVPPGARIPTNVYALGLVDKKSDTEPFRCIHDCRPKNEAIDPWAERKMHGVTACRYLYGALCWCFHYDISMAYYSVSLMGCGGGLRRTGALRHDGSYEYVIGCVPEPYGCLGEESRCKGGCDKDRMGFFWRHDWVFQSPAFGMRVSSNALSMLTAPFVRRYRKEGVRLILWVDDLQIIVLNPHPRKTGSEASMLAGFEVIRNVVAFSHVHSVSHRTCVLLTSRLASSRTSRIWGGRRMRRTQTLHMKACSQAFITIR